MESKDRRPTLKDVAALSGVSVISASRVMRGAPNISKQLREKVEQAARSIGYQSNPIARSLRGESTELVTVIVPSMSNHVFPNIVDGIDDALKDSPLRLVLGMTKYESRSEEVILQDMLGWNPAGVVLSGLEHSARSRELLEHFSGPIVEVMDVDGDAIDMAVGTSMVQAGELIAQHLVAKHYRRIGYVGAWGERPKRSLKRRLAFEAELQRLDAPLVASVILDEASSLQAGARGLQQLLAENPEIDAVFFANDDLAMGALFHCQSHGIGVPGDIAIAGFNGLDISQSIRPQLTTIATPRYEIGHLAGELLRQRIMGDTSRNAGLHRLEQTLIEGGTT
ncbi:LacI family DNA-binding transcriptional regulator [Granulosicoccus sp. 3-233]|uniref:LacI family DNA-binding transcriptional regulator n=1 Tax=Granulosicoccus sp. 3-233 TaxID=3417969 RepID=UPI003D34E810